MQPIQRLKLLSNQAFLHFLGRLMCPRKITAVYTMNNKPLNMTRFVLINDRSSQGEIQMHGKRSRA